MLDQLEIPLEIFPELYNFSEIYVDTKPEIFFNARLPIAGDAGDLLCAEQEVFRDDRRNPVSGKPIIHSDTAGRSPS